MHASIRKDMKLSLKDKRLIVNADDMGVSRGVTDGILLAHRNGVVTSTSLMVNQTASEYAVEQLRASPTLEVGIHLNLCEGAPVLPPKEVATLVTNAGGFYPPEEMERRLRLWQVSPREIAAEFRAQIRWMKDRTVNPTHANSHHHLHLYPCALRAFCSAIGAEGITRIRAPRRRYWPANGSIGLPHAGAWHRRLLVSAYMDLVQFTVFWRFAMPDCCLVPTPRRQDDLHEGWTAALKAIPPGTYELNCHPGVFEAPFSKNVAWSEWAKRRQSDVDILTDPQFRAVMEDNDIRLISYCQLESSPQVLCDTALTKRDFMH